MPLGANPLFGKKVLSILKMYYYENKLLLLFPRYNLLRAGRSNSPLPIPFKILAHFPFPNFSREGRQHWTKITLVPKFLMHFGYLYLNEILK